MQQTVEAASRAATIAATAAPDEEIPKLDLAAIAEAKGDSKEGERIVAEVCRQRDTDGPLELAERTTKLMIARNFLSPNRRAG